MAKDNLQEQVNDLKRLLAAHGIVMPGDGPGRAEQTDHIAFGSDAHRQLIGLVEVEDGDDVQGFTTFKSPYSDKVYRLEDELGVVNLYPGVDPDKAAILVLKMKINELEGGPPTIPDNAPSMWVPVDENMTLIHSEI